MVRDLRRIARLQFRVRSRLDRYRADIEALAAAGASSYDIALWLRKIKRIKYAAALKQAGEWARDQGELRHLHEITPALAQQYLADRAALGIRQKQLDTDRIALEFITGKGTLARETALSEQELHCRAYTIMISGAATPGANPSAMPPPECSAGHMERTACATATPKSGCWSCRGWASPTIGP
jgi:hypothetical protein